MTYDFYCRAFKKDSWSNLTQEEKATLTEMMYPNVVEEAEKILVWLTDRSLVINEKTDDGRYSYTDNRKTK